MSLAVGEPLSSTRPTRATSSSRTLPTVRRRLEDAAGFQRPTVDREPYKRLTHHDGAARRAGLDLLRLQHRTQMPASPGPTTDARSTAGEPHLAAATVLAGYGIEAPRAGEPTRRTSTLPTRADRRGLKAPRNPLSDRRAEGDSSAGALGGAREDYLDYYAGSSGRVVPLPRAGLGPGVNEYLTWFWRASDYVPGSASSASRRSRAEPGELPPGMLDADTQAAAPAT